jgi:cyclopropane-fatty-acyl-phospholipid synthase
MLDRLIARGLFPDPLLRLGVRQLCRHRLRQEDRPDGELLDQSRRLFLDELRRAPVAIETDKANDQHYRVPTAFFQQVLGDQLKYSCSYWLPEWKEERDLALAEDKMLELTIERARLNELVPGQKILELGCGWGAITLAMARRFPHNPIVAVSNSETQKAHIEARLQKEGLTNVEILTCNVALLERPLGEYERVVSVEMFEHMRNYEELLKRISLWLTPTGLLFVHIFVHREKAYKYEVVDETDWMSKYFFSGGTMPSEHLLYYFQKDLKVLDHWRVNGTHYGKTSRAWLYRMDQRKSEIMKIFTEHYGRDQALQWWNYWRLFFLTCDEFFRFNRGKEWFVGHYLLGK